MAQLIKKLRIAVAIATTAIMISGCNSLGLTSDDAQVKDQDDTVRSMSQAPVQILYRTKTDRLNLTGADLPACSMATLQIQVPHPHYKSDAGFARLTVLPTSVDPELTPGDQSTATGPTPAVWEGDVPLWQVDAIVRELEQANFFRRAKVLGAETFLAVSTVDGKLGRPYRNVSELDAIVVRLSQSRVSPTHGEQRPELARLPHIDQR